MKRNLYLVGYRGTGKSTVGRLVAAELGWSFVDLDERVEAAAGASIAVIFAGEGEAGFRARESAALTEIFRAGRVSDGLPSVIATGGGIILREENRRLLNATGFVVWLQASAEAIWDRIQTDTLTAARRPNLTIGGGLPEIVELLAVRERYYTEVADARMPTDGRSPEVVATAILTLYRSIPSD